MRYSIQFAGQARSLSNRSLIDYANEGKGKMQLLQHFVNNMPGNLSSFEGLSGNAVLFNGCFPGHTCQGTSRHLDGQGSSRGKKGKKKKKKKN